MNSQSSFRVLITGGASGLGRAMAEEWARHGARVAVADIHQERLQETLSALGKADGHLAIPLDVTQDAQWAEAMDTVQQHWGGLDLLINNAGIATGGPCEAESLDNWQKVLDINLLGIVRGCQAALPSLRTSEGHILNIASMAGLIHPPMMGSYNAVKAAVVAYSETLRFELEDDGVDVHVLCPGFFKTNLAESLPEEQVGMQQMLEKIFAKAQVTAVDVARTAREGVEAGRFLILSHPEGKQAFHVKRLFPEILYPRMMRQQTAGMIRAWRKPSKASV